MCIQFAGYAEKANLTLLSQLTQEHGIDMLSYGSQLQLSVIKLLIYNDTSILSIDRSTSV